MSAPPSNNVSKVAGGASVSFGSFRLDYARRLLLKDGEPVRIGSRALDLLVALIDRAGEVVSRHELLDLVWRDVVVDDAGVRVHISSLRRVLGDGQDGARYIVNVAGRGYSFVAPIIRGQPEAPLPQIAPRTPRLTGRVPSPPGLLVGRGPVVDSVSELLLARRFVSIVGSGGIGKTTVAVAIADKLRTEFGDENAAFVDLGAVSEPGLVAGAVILAVGCTIGGSDCVGASAVLLPGGEIFQALQTGTIDATEWVGPWNDSAMGFYRVAKFYYAPGWHEPSSNCSAGINLSVWSSLSSADREIIKSACHAENDVMECEFKFNDTIALDQLVRQHDVQLRVFSDDVLKALGKAAREVVAESAQKDPLTQKVYESYMAFHARARRVTTHSDQAYVRARSMVFEG